NCASSAAPAKAAPAKPGLSEPRRMVAEAGRAAQPAPGRSKEAPAPITSSRLVAAPVKGASVSVRTAQAVPMKAAPLQHVATKNPAKPAVRTAAAEPAHRMAALPPTSKQAIARLAGAAPAGTAAKPGAKAATKAATKTAAQTPAASGAKSKRSQVAAAN
ncbi:septal ring lytic transglycosylase RlpA family protein, partial [Methylorubrum thiocyanatum]